MKIREITANDYQQWKPLFEGYCQFYHQDISEEKNQVMWNWLLDSKHMLTGLVIEDDSEKIQGFAHYHAWPVSIYACDICYLSDLFVNPEVRGQKFGKALYEHLLQECQKQGWPALSLLTQDDNTTARALYEQHGERSDFSFYLSPIEL